VQSSKNSPNPRALALFWRLAAAQLVLSLFALLLLPGLAVESGNRAFVHFIKFQPNPNKRVLNFPNDYSLGEIAVSKDPFSNPDKSLNLAAKGSVAISPSSYVSFMPKRHFYQHPNLLDKLPPDAFDRIEITFVSMDDSEDALCADAVKAIAHFHGLTELILDRSDVTDDALASIKDMTKLQILNAFATSLSGKCFKEFANLKNLRYMDFQGSGILDKNIKYLANMPNLKYLNFAHCNISDAGIAGIASNKDLEFLDIGENPKITDASIETIKGLPHLRNLIIFQTSITFDGVMKLKGLPLAQIIMPSRALTPSQLATLSKTFPGVAIGPFKDAKKVDSFTKEMYAPLH
jgi:hypothetical protein